MSCWLKKAVRKETEAVPLRASGDETEDLKAVLELMRGYRIEEAAILAADAGFMR